jgi:GDP-4-dehydro-6-deoxy-D-mannose reductase
MRALITGVGGFVGRHLARHLCAEGVQVSGVGRAPDCRDLSDDVEMFTADLRDRTEVLNVAQTVRPDAVYHLAAQSSSSQSLADPWGTLANNLQAQLSLLDALLGAGLRPRVLVVGSSDEYGRVRPDQIPIHEDVPLRPTTPYAVSKVTQDVLGFQYFAQHGLPVVRVRPFSHTGPGHDPRFVVPSFARQLAQIEAGQLKPEIRVGNLDVYRDFTDVRDMVRAYRLALLAGTPGEVYNLGRGTAIRIGDALDDLISLCRVPVRVVVDTALLRPFDVPRQQADTTKFRALTGWQPEIPWQTTLRETLDYWRARVGVASSIA